MMSARVSRIVRAPAVDRSLRRGGGRSSPRPLSPVAGHALAVVGHPLDDRTKASMEMQLGHDFSTVRVHTDGHAAASARALGARAYTRGNDIVFAGGAYAPHTPGGRRLLAHELVHVVQHRAAPAQSGARLTSTSDHAAERQARTLAQHVASALPIGAWRPVAADARLSLEPETWYRGQVEGVAPANDVSQGKGVVHDLGPGKYFTDSESVAREYASMRGPGKQQVIGGQIDIVKLGKVLDLTKQPDFMRHFNHVKQSLVNVSGEPYRNMFDAFLKQKGLKLNDFHMIIGPEGVRSGRQMCVRDPEVLKKVLTSMKPLTPGGGPSGGGTPPKSGTTPAKGGSKKPAQAGAQVTTSKAPRSTANSVTTSVPKPNFRQQARAAAKSLRGRLGGLAKASVLTSGIKVVTFISDVHKIIKFTGMASSRLSGGGFVMTRELEWAEEAKAKAEKLNTSYDSFTEEMDALDLHLLFLEAGQDAHAAKEAMTAVTNLLDAPDFADLAEAIPKRIAALSTAAKEARAKEEIIDKLLSDPPLLFDSDDLATLFAGYEDLGRIAAALERAVTALRVLDKKVKADRKWLERWHLALLRKCLEGGVCSFVP